MSTTTPLHWKVLKAARLKAETLVSRFGIVEPPVDVRTMAVRMGVIVVDTENTPDWSGALDNTREVPVIWVRGGDPDVRKRFTIAHELGHLMLHEAGMLWRDVTFHGGPKEAQANGYAAKLLMPEAMINRAVARRRTATLGELGDMFEVSSQAMEYRLRSLGFVRD